MAMDMIKVQAKIDEISVMLYQNREQQALEQVGIFLGELKYLTDELQQANCADIEQIQIYILQMYQELYDAYANKDMLGMADCLQDKVMLITELYRMNCIGRM